MFFHVDVFLLYIKTKPAEHFCSAGFYISHRCRLAARIALVINRKVCLTPQRKTLPKKIAVSRIRSISPIIPLLRNNIFQRIYFRLKNLDRFFFGNNIFQGI